MSPLRTDGGSVDRMGGIMPTPPSGIPLVRKWTKVSRKCGVVAIRTSPFTTWRVDVRSRVRKHTKTRTHSTVGRRAPEHGRAGHSVAKQVKQLDRVIIRFAGDSGDGMQLTGDRFTQESAAFGNDLVDAARTSPPRSARPRARCPGVSSFQVHFADHDILTPGDAPRRAGRDEPGGAAGQPRRPAQGRDDHRGHPRLHRPQPHQGRLRRRTRSDGRRRSPSYAVHAVDLTGMTVEAVKEFGLSRKDAARAKNMFALGLLSWMYGRPDRDHDRVPRAAVRQGRPTSATPTSRRSRPAGTSARPPRRSSVQYEVKPAPMPAGTYRNITGNLALAYGLVAGGVQSGPAAVPRLLPDHPGLRHPPRAEQAQARSASRRSRPRTRSPASAPPSVRRSPARSA